MQFQFDIDQIKEIYDAGRRRGSEEAVAYDWGSNTSGDKFDECIQTMHEILNKGKNFDDSDYTTYDVIAAWFKS